MLLSTLKAGESIKIGDHIEIKVLEVQGQRVQLGIAAPKDIKVSRPAAQDRPADKK